MSLETIAPLSDDPISKLPRGGTAPPCPPDNTTAAPLWVAAPLHFFRFGGNNVVFSVCWSLQSSPPSLRTCK